MYTLYVCIIHTQVVNECNKLVANAFSRKEIVENCDVKEEEMKISYCHVRFSEPPTFGISLAWYFSSCEGKVRKS